MSSHYVDGRDGESESVQVQYWLSLYPFQMDMNSWNVIMKWLRFYSRLLHFCECNELVIILALLCVRRSLLIYLILFNFFLIFHKYLCILIIDFVAVRGKLGLSRPVSGVNHCLSFKVAWFGAFNLVLPQLWNTFTLNIIT